jgi:hypothetical protein
MKNTEGLGRKRDVEGRKFIRILLHAVSSLNVIFGG